MLINRCGYSFSIITVRRGDLLIGGGQCSIDGMGSKLLQLFNA